MWILLASLIRVLFDFLFYSVHRKLSFVILSLQLSKPPLKIRISFVYNTIMRILVAISFNALFVLEIANLLPLFNEEIALKLSRETGLYFFPTLRVTELDMESSEV